MQEDFHYIAKVLASSTMIKESDYGTGSIRLRFKDSLEALLFGLLHEECYLPSQTGTIHRLQYYEDRYLKRFVSAMSSLRKEYGSLLQNRRTVFLVNRQILGDPKKDKDQEPQSHKSQNEGFVRNAIDQGIEPNEVIIAYTNGGEEFYQAFGALALRRRGYVVFPEPVMNDLLRLSGPPVMNGFGRLDRVGGAPDAIAMKLGDFQKALITNKTIERGALLPEFELISNVPDCEAILAGLKASNSRCEVAAVEYKGESASARSSGRTQVKRYLATRYFNRGFLVCPCLKGDEKYYDYSYVTYDKAGDEHIHVGTKERGDPKKIAEAIHLGRKLVSLTILKNVPLKDIASTHGERTFTELLY